MMEPSFDRREDVVVGFAKKGVAMESDERISNVLKNGIHNWGSSMQLNGEVAGSGYADDGNFGPNLVKSSEMRAINLVVDLSHCFRKEYDRNAFESSVNKANDVEFTEKEGEYEFSDLVWVKVKNHQWWPGQIINPSASKAMKHSKINDRFLVAYIGDHRSAFHELNDIKPFRSNFCKMAIQSNGEAFVHAVNDALREAARRVEFGLSCLCLSEEVYDKIKSQIAVNLGIRNESRRIEGGDRFSTVNSFNPAKTVGLLQDLAKNPFGINRLDVSIVGGQLSAFNWFKGYHQLQLNQIIDELDDEFNANNSTHCSKRKLNSRGRLRKCKHVFDDDFSLKKKVRRLSEMMSDAIESVSDVEYKPIKRGSKRRVIESNRSADESQSQSQTADEFLSQIYLAARNPIEGQQNLDSLVKFSSDFKNFQLRENKNDEEIAKQPETDYSTKPNQENGATALTFKFTNLDRVPSVRKLHEIFRRYGALHETETRVLRKKKCVRLVFKRKCDAETAFSSTGKFSIFGPALVSYRLNFSPILKKTQLAKRG